MPNNTRIDILIQHSFSIFQTPSSAYCQRKVGMNTPSTAAYMFILFFSDLTHKYIDSTGKHSKVVSYWNHVSTHYLTSTEWISAKQALNNQIIHVLYDRKKKIKRKVILKTADAKNTIENALMRYQLSTLLPIYCINFSPINAT